MKSTRFLISAGFTLIEILIVVSILGLLLSVTIPSFTAFRQNSSLNGDALNLVTLISRARLLAVADKGDVQYGIHLESSKVVLYPGTTYTAGASSNETYTFSSGITLSNIEINGGGSEILFNKVTGSTTQNATTTLRVTSTNASSTVIILNSGIATIL